MLLDRARDISSKISAFQKLKLAADKAGNFATRAHQFTDLSQRIKRTKTSLEMLRKAGVPVAFKPHDGTGLEQRALILRDAIKLDPSSINEPPFDLKYEFIDRLAEITKAGERAALLAWSSYVEARASFGSDDVLGALAAVPQFRASVLRIRAIRANVASFGSSLPVNPAETVSKINALVEEHEKAWVALEAADIPSSVVAFIRAAANQDAMLSAFTEEVRLWLDSKNLLNAFRIRLR
jgi:hypothetical protein